MTISLFGKAPFGRSSFFGRGMEGFTPLPPGPSDFTCLDISGTPLHDVFLMPEVTRSRSTPWIDVDGSNQLVIYSNDSVNSWFQFEISYESSYTFETTFKPSSLPDDLYRLNQYCFFIGVYDKQNKSAGVLLSNNGLALVSSYGTSILPLPGSQDLIKQIDDYYTLRIVVDGDASLAYIYLTLTSDIPIIGQQLRFTTSALHTPIGIPDSFRIDLVGSSDKPITGKFLNLRCNCVEALIPNKPPIADAGADQTSNMGSSVRYDGTDSYDPEGVPIIYSWALISAPNPSRFKIFGTSGSTYNDGDSDAFTNIFVGGVNAFSVDNAPLLQPYDHLIIDDIVYQVSNSRWAYDVTTSKYIRDIGGSWNNDEIVITDDTLPIDFIDITWAIYHSRTYFNDLSLPTPFAIPDISGIYTVQLVVSDGELDSSPSTVLLNVSQTSVALGCIPELSWIWNLLSDFWNLLEDREMVETVWSGFAQAAAAQLLTAWQIDYNKSLLDIQRVFQRRWLSYSTSVPDNSETASIRILRGAIVSANLANGVYISGKTLQLILDNGAVETITFSGTDPLTAEEIAAQINTQMGFDSAVEKLAKVESLGTDISGGDIEGYGGDSEYGAGTGYGGHGYYYVASDYHEYLILDYALLLRIRPNGTANVDLGYSIEGYTQNDIQGSLGNAVSGLNLKAFTAITPPILDFTSEGVVNDLLVMEDIGYRIQKVAFGGAPHPPSITPENRGLTLLDDLPIFSSDLPWIVPSVVLSTILNFDDELIIAGDIAIFEVKSLVTNLTLEVNCQVVGVRGAQLGFNPLPLLELWAGYPSNFRTRFLGTKRARYIPVDSLVVEIPRLQEIIKNPPSVLEQNMDFFIAPIAGQNAIQFQEGTFSYMNPPPNTLWAEITYLDNNPNIENNFGWLVDFKVEDLETRTDDLDYLSAVRGLWWSYFGGPALSKVRTGVQILLGLPFAEAAGVIQTIEPAFSAVEGRILIRDSGDVNIIRTYFYPLTAGLANNPVTNLPYQEGDTIDIFVPLCGGVEVEDYISDPNWMRNYVSQGKFSELHKFLYFLIRMNVDTFNLSNLIFAQDFARKIRPHYTYPLFTLLKILDPTEIDVLDVQTMKISYRVINTFASPLNPGAFIWDDANGSGIWRHYYNEASPEFLHDTHRLHPVDVVTITVSA